MNVTFTCLLVQRTGLYKAFVHSLLPTHNTMELDRSFSILLSLVLMGLLSSASSTSFISDGVLDVHPSTARTLLQAKKGCPVNFEFLNYTVITSECKGPHYPVDRCCSSFKDFACPYADMLNDLTNDCASTMFSYINLYGRYPPGLFASECRDSKRGLECPADSPSEALNNNGNAKIVPFSSLLYLLVSALLVLLLWF